LKNGILYIAFGGHKLADHTKEVVCSAESVKKMHPDLHITLFTNNHMESGSDHFDEIVQVPIGGERVKQELLYNSPYESTLYLDTDTMIVNPIGGIFDLMGRFDIAATIDHVRKAQKVSDIYPDYASIPDGFSEYGGGVILFRKSDAVEKFFEVWRKNYSIWQEASGRDNDQPSFRVSLWECSDLKVHTLPPEFNIRTQEKRDKIKNIVPRIFHWHNMYDPTLKRTPQKF